MARMKYTKRKTEMNYNGPDRISELPDPIILHIFSFLDIRYVILTSLLSRRFRFLWTSLRYLNISDEVYNDWRSPNGYVNHNALKIDFTDFVHRMLLMRDQRSNISSFRFSYTDTDSDHNGGPTKEKRKFLGDIYSCILVLIRSNIKVIDLRISSMPDRINLPSRLLNCISLTTLKLDMEPNDINVGPVQPDYNLPTESGMNLPALRFLLLRSLSIVGDVGKLISSCPVLEVFIFSKCRVNLCGRQLNISGSQLKMLEIEEVEDFGSETDSLKYCNMKVFAPKLTSFISRSTTMNEYTFVDTSSLVNAEIETDEYSCGLYFYDDGKESDQRIIWKQEFNIHLIKCFGGIRNVRSLTLSAWLLTIIPEAQAVFGSLLIHPFHNLRILNLKTSLWKREIYGITCLLKKCPTLETLVLEMIEYEGGFTVREDDVWKAELEPQCMMDHLKLIEIWYILTCVNELEFIKFLLKNATILEKMIVHIPKKQPLCDYMRLKSFGEKLKTFPAASSKTRISFVSDAEPRLFFSGQMQSQG